MAITFVFFFSSKEENLLAKLILRRDALQSHLDEDARCSQVKMSEIIGKEYHRQSSLTEDERLRNLLNEDENEPGPSGDAGKARDDNTAGGNKNGGDSTGVSNEGDKDKGKGKGKDSASEEDGEKETIETVDIESDDDGKEGNRFSGDIPENQMGLPEFVAMANGDLPFPPPSEDRETEASAKKSKSSDKRKRSVEEGESAKKSKA